MPKPTSRRKKRKLSATSEEGARAAVAADPVPMEVVAAAAKAEVAVKNPEGNRPGERRSPEKVHATGADRAEGKDAGAVEVVALVAEEIAVRVVATPEQAPSA